MTIVPAYGRDYKSAKDAKADFDANKDFQIVGLNDQGSFADDGRYVNKADLPKGTRITIRFAKLSKVVGYVVNNVPVPTLLHEPQSRNGSEGLSPEDAVVDGFERFCGLQD